MGAYSDLSRTIEDCIYTVLSTLPDGQTISLGRLSEAVSRRTRFIVSSWEVKQAVLNLRMDGALIGGSEKMFYQVRTLEQYKVVSGWYKDKLEEMQKQCKAMDKTAKQMFAEFGYA